MVEAAQPVAVNASESAPAQVIAGRSQVDELEPALAHVEKAEEAV